MKTTLLARAAALLLLAGATSCTALGIKGVDANHVAADEGFNATLRAIDLDGWVAAGAPLGDRPLLDIGEREAVQVNIDAWRLHVAQAAERAGAFR